MRQVGVVEVHNTSLVCIDTQNDVRPSLDALRWSATRFQTKEIIFFTKSPFHHWDWAEENNVQIRLIQELKGTKGVGSYSQFCIEELGKNKFVSDFLLIVQADGFVLDSSFWTDDFLSYDIIGSPFFNVLNGGFTLRSLRLHQFLSENGFDGSKDAEDVLISGTWRRELEKRFSFPPTSVASRFSYGFVDTQPVKFRMGFGFHKIDIQKHITEAREEMG